MAGIVHFQINACGRLTASITKFGDRESAGEALETYQVFCRDGCIGISRKFREDRESDNFVRRLFA